MIIGLDFDGTVVEHAYPEIGRPIPGAIEKLKEFADAGHLIVLNTMRSGQKLAAAVRYLESNGIELYGVNETPRQRAWTKSPKVYARVYIDDAAYGCPLIYPKQGRPHVDWSRIEIGGKGE